MKKNILFCLPLVVALLTTGCSSETRRTSVESTEPVTPENRIAYELNVGAFAAEDTSQVVMTLLGRLDTLGVDILWLKSISGTVGNLGSIVDAAHRLGMNVWLDCENVLFALQDTLSETTADAMNVAMKSWCGETGVNGFCCDYPATPDIPAQYWHDVIRELRGMKPDLEFVSKADISNPENKSLDACDFDFDCASEFRQQLTRCFAQAQPQADSVRNVCEQFLSASKAVQSQRIIRLGNLDKSLGENAHWEGSHYVNYRYNLAVLLFTLYGMPLFCLGEENLADKKMTNLVRTLISLHHAEPSLSSRTEVSFLPTNDPHVLAYQRGRVIVVLNLGAEDAHLNIIGIEPGDYDQCLESNSIAHGTSVRNVVLSPAQSIALEAHGFAVYVANESD